MIGHSGVVIGKLSSAGSIIGIDRKSGGKMETYNARLFYAIARTLENLVNYGQTDHGDHTVKQKVIASHVKGLKKIAKDCKEVGLEMSAMCAVGMLARLRTPKIKITHLECSRDFEVLQNRIQDEMSQVLILRIPRERAKRWHTLVAFEFSGRGVKFPSTTFDAFEAGHCFAAGRFTACVFHLMCILELGLRAFAKVFNVPADHKNWHNIIEGIEAKIRNMGHDPKKARNWKARQEKYAQAANSFMFFKDAWRNYTAHARGKFTEEQADIIYRNVRSFMEHLAKIGLSE